MQEDTVWFPFKDMLRIYLGKLFLNLFISMLQASICHSLVYPILWGENIFSLKGTSIKANNNPMALAFKVSFLNTSHTHNMSPFATH